MRTNAPALAAPVVAVAKGIGAAVPGPAPDASLTAPKAAPLSRYTFGLRPQVASSLAPQVRQFEERYRDVQVVKQPTTSGWTWLFLAWALSNSLDNSRHERDNAAMRSRMVELERQLRNDPLQWQQLQELAPLQVAAPAPAASSVSGAAGTGAQVSDVATLASAAATEETDESSSSTAPAAIGPSSVSWAPFAIAVAILAMLVGWVYTLKSS